MSGATSKCYSVFRGSVVQTQNIKVGLIASATDHQAKNNTSTKKD